MLGYHANINGYRRTYIEHISNILDCIVFLRINFSICPSSILSDIFLPLQAETLTRTRARYMHTELQDKPPWKDLCGGGRPQLF